MLDARLEAASPFSQSEIGDIEKALARSLPAAYREFVLVYGGAFVGGSVDGSNDLPVLKFLSASSVLSALAQYADLKTDRILPFARCELGNLYVLDEADAIHYINYYGGKTTVLKISGDFRDFLARIVVGAD
jgi:hypothetical protein